MKIDAWGAKLLIFEKCSIQISLFYHLLFVQKILNYITPPTHTVGEIPNFPFVGKK